MPGEYESMGALSRIPAGGVSDKEMMAFEGMRPAGPDGMPSTPKPKYTPESLKLMMQQPEMMSLMQEISATSGIPMEKVIEVFPTLPQDTLEEIMGDVFNKMK
jgi:hypothetical protein